LSSPVRQFYFCKAYLSRGGLEIIVMDRACEARYWDSRSSDESVLFVQTLENREGAHDLGPKEMSSRYRHITAQQLESSAARRKTLDGSCSCKCCTKGVT
jgi:hypothetical protein